MTTRELLDSIRDHLDSIAAGDDDLDLEPDGNFRIVLERLNAQAECIALAWGEKVKPESVKEFV